MAAFARARPSAFAGAWLAQGKWEKPVLWVGCFPGWLDYRFLQAYKVLSMSTAATLSSDATLLIVDDEQVYLDMITQTLQDRGYRVFQALNGKTGCAVAGMVLPEVIIMDWEMPVMNGLEAIQRLKEQETTKDIPIIMATGAKMKMEHLELALAAGAMDYIRKPINLVELLARLNSILSLSRYIGEIKRQKQIYQELSHEKDGLIGLVAHDLRAPLVNVSAVIEMLKVSGALSDQQRELTRMISKACQDGLELIGDLLDINHLEHESSRLSCEDIALDEFLEKQIAIFKPVASRKQIEIVFHRNPIPLRMKSDPRLVSRIFDNLISNAIKFSPPATKIVVAVFEQDACAAFSIKDQGPGFTDLDKSQLYKKFQRLSAQPTAGESSSGLGLAIIKALVDKLGGMVELTSAPGEGAEFVVKIPKHPESPAAS
jgi:two-component system sensor histidine kinase/response regulator